MSSTSSSTYFAFALVTATFLSGCLAPTAEVAPDRFQPASSGSLVLALERQPEVTLQLRQPMPGHGDNAHLNLLLNIETTHATIPIDILTTFAWFSSPLTPGEVLGAHGRFLWFDQPGAREQSITFGGSRLAEPTPWLSAAYRTGTDLTYPPGGGTIEVNHVFNTTYDRRNATDLGVDDPLDYNVLVGIVTSAPERLDLTAEVSWSGGAASIWSGTARSIQTWRPSDAGSTASVAIGPANLGMGNELAIDFDPTELGTFAFYFPPVYLTREDPDSYQGTAYVQPPGMDRQYLEDGRLAAWHWIVEPGTWRFGQDHLAQVDRWDQPSLVTMRVADLTDTGRA